MAILVKRVNRNIRVSRTDREIRVNNVSRNITVHAVGRRGPQGIQGDQGEQGPEGPAGPGGGDKNYLENFTNQASVTVTHNLGKYPAVTVHDSTGDEVEGQVEHLTINQLVITFSSSFTGRVSCN